MALTCPEESNYAAIAKQLHSTALQAETEISALEQQMRGAVNLPTVVSRLSADETGIPASVDYDVGLNGSWASVFDNTASGSGFGPQNFSSFTSFLGEGLYEVGFCATAVASGVVNDNSTRFFFINHLRPDPDVVGGERFLQRVAITLFESNTGVGTEMSIVGHFRAQPLDRFAFFFVHGNTSSTMNILAGAYIWGTKISDSTLNRVL